MELAKVNFEPRSVGSRREDGPTHSPRTGAKPAATYCGTHALFLRLQTSRDLSPDPLALKDSPAAPSSFLLLLFLLSSSLPPTQLLHAKADTSLSLNAVWWLELRHID